MVKKVDIIEAFNARESPGNNQKALEFAKKWNKPALSGASDAHFMRDIGTCRMIISTMDIRTELLRSQCR